MVPKRGLRRLFPLILMVIALVSVAVTYLRIQQSSIPLNHNIHNQEGYIITNLEIRTCSLFGNEHRLSGNWFKVSKALHFNHDGKKTSKLRQQYLFVEKVPLGEINELETEVITNLHINEGGDQMWKFDRVKYLKDQSEEYIYNIDILFGVDAVDPRPTWELLPTPIFGTTEEVPVYITVKRSPENVVKKPRLSIDAGVGYKILQVADLHFSTDEGVCRDQFPEVPDCKADRRTLKFVETVLDIEKPDLVVLTGDQIFGDDSFDSITTMLKVVNPFIKRQIPYAIMFGNHDDEGSLTREELITFVESLPYSLAQSGPPKIDGFGNYVISVKDKTDQSDILTFYVLDSHKYSQRPKTNPGYDWIKENQLLFVERQHEAILKTHKNHLSFGLFHIPLPEYRNTNNQPLIGNYKEGITAPKYNTHGRDVLAKVGVSIVSVGHDHCNDYCLLDSSKDQGDKIWLCYGGGSGEGGYGGYGGTTRRLRVFEVDTSEATVKTYKKLETSPNEKFDEQILVQNKQVVNY